MKSMIKLYRMLKPVFIYTSYLFTSLCVLYLAVYELSGRQFPLTPGLLWGLFGFSLGSIGLQRLLIGSELLERVWYPIRLALYVCGTALWGSVCPGLFMALYGAEAAGEALLPALILGVLCCIGLEIFNRYRAHMYNTLLEQYKRRRR